MIDQQKTMTSKTEVNPSFSSKDELGQVILDEQRVHLITNLIQLYIHKDTDKKVIEVLSRKIATYGYESNINYKSVRSIFELNKLSLNILNKVYSNFSENRSIFNLSELILNPKEQLKIGKRELINFDNKLRSTFYLSNRNSYPSCRLSNKEDVSLIESEGRVIKCTYKDEERTQHVQDKDLLRCCPTKVEVYTNPEDDIDVVYNWTFIRMIDKKILTINEVTLSQTANFINELGMSANNRETADTLSHCLVAMAKSKDETLYDERERYVKKGFAFNSRTGRIDVENYTLINSTDKEIKDALLLFNEYLGEFKTDNEKLYLVTNFKWGLISPFVFAKKQMDKSTKNLIPYPYLMGVGNTGKTTAHGDMVLSMWYDDISSGEVSGGRVETVPQIAYEVEESTLPKVFDEAGTIFENEYDKRSRDRLKDLINRIKFRHTRNKNGREFKSINSFIITSNGEIHDTQTGVTRRLLIENFTDEEYKSEEQIQYFNQKYMIGEPENKLYQLKHISHSFAKNVINNPELLLENWMKVVDDFVTHIYKKYDVQKPEILNQWIEAKEISIKEEKLREEEHVRHAFIKMVNANKRFFKEPIDNPYLFVELCILQGISGMDISIRGDEKDIIITRPFIDDLAKKRWITKEYDLKVFCNRFNFKYTRNNNNRIGKKDYKEFVEWLYPNHPALE